MKSAGQEFPGRPGIKQLGKAFKRKGLKSTISNNGGKSFLKIDPLNTKVGTEPH